MKPLFCTMLAATLLACAAELEQRKPSLDHPSNPDAPESRPLAISALAPDGALPGGADRAEGHAGHDHAAPGAATRGPTEPSAAEYTCPMHPSIVQSEPGTCPVCGMALVPREPAEKPPRPSGVPDSSRHEHR